MRKNLKPEPLIDDSFKKNPADAPDKKKPEKQQKKTESSKSFISFAAILFFSMLIVSATAIYLFIPDKKDQHTNKRDKYYEHKEQSAVIPAIVPGEFLLNKGEISRKFNVPLGSFLDIRFNKSIKFIKSDGTEKVLTREKHTELGDDIDTFELEAIHNNTRIMVIISDSDTPNTSSSFSKKNRKKQITDKDMLMSVIEIR
ncbi:MAG: hypothetical protein ABIG10_04005 [bacterium]